MSLGHTRPPQSISDKDNNDDDSDSNSDNDPFVLELPTPTSASPSPSPTDIEARESVDYASEVVEAAESSPLNRDQQLEQHQQHQPDRRRPILATTTIADCVSSPFGPRVHPLIRLTSHLSLLSSLRPTRQPATSAAGESITTVCTGDVSEKETEMGLNNLPYDLLLNIASYLDLYDIHALQLTSKNLYDFATTRPVYRKLANDLLRRCRALPLKGFQRITDLTTEQLIRSVNKATRYEVAWRYRAPKPIAVPSPDSILAGHKGEYTNASGSESSSVVEARRGFDGSAAGVALGIGFGGSMGHSNYMDSPEAPACSASSDSSLPGSSFASDSSYATASTSITCGTSSTIIRPMPEQIQSPPRNWYKVVSAPPDEDVDWLSPITSSYTLCATKSGKVVCWDVQTDSCLAEWNPGARWELWKCRVEFEERTVFFTMARVLSGSYNDERVMEFVLMKLCFFDSPSGLRSPDPPVFSHVTEFKTTGVVMNVFLLDPSARLLSAFIWVASTNTIGLYALLDWDKDECVFVDTGIECVVTSNWSCILYEDHIVIHCEESDAAYQHFYPIDLLQAHSKALPNKRAIPTITAKLRPAKTLSKKFLFPRIDHMEFEDGEGEDDQEEEESEAESVNENGVTYYVVPTPSFHSGDSPFDDELFRQHVQPDDEVGVDAMFYGWASSSSASAPANYPTTDLTLTSIMTSSAAVSSNGDGTSSSVIAQPQLPITLNPAHLHAPAPTAILIPVPNPPMPSSGSQTQAPAPLLHPQPLPPPPPPPQLPHPPPPVPAAPAPTHAHAHAHIPIPPPNQNPFPFPPWYPESAHFVRQWWPSLPGIPRVSCTVVLLASHDQDTHKTKFVLAQHYFRVPLSRLEWAGGMLLPTPVGMEADAGVGYAAAAISAGVNGHGTTNGTTDAVPNGIRNGAGDVSQRQPEGNSSGTSSSNSSSPSTTASYASTSNTHHSSSSFASSSTNATAYSITTSTPPSYGHQPYSHMHNMSSLGTCSSSQPVYTEEDEELDNALMQLWYVSKPFEVVCVSDGAEEEDEMGMERPRPLVAVDFGHAVWIEYFDAGDGDESEHGHETDDDTVDADTSGDEGAGEASGSSMSGYKRGKSLLASMIENDGVDVDVDIDVDSGVDSNGVIEALQHRHREESPQPQVRQRRRSRKLNKALRFVTFPPFNENGINSDPVELRRDSEREQERRARIKGKGKSTANVGSENENVEWEAEIEGRAVNGHGHPNGSTGGSISDRWREGHVRTLEIPDELDLDTVETINIDQSQGAVILSVQEGKIFILCYE